jgi:hypothetical protein
MFGKPRGKKGGDCCDAVQTDKTSERDCGRRYIRQEGQSVIDKRNTRNEKNAQTQREGDTAADMDEARMMETTTMRGVILRMRMGSMRMGQEARVIGQPRTPNGDRLAVFTSQQEQ